MEAIDIFFEKVRIKFMQTVKNIFFIRYTSTSLFNYLINILILLTDRSRCKNA